MGAPWQAFTRKGSSGSDRQAGGQIGAASTQLAGQG